MQKFIFVEPERHKLAIAICEAAGLEPASIRRIVIDLDRDQVGYVYVQHFGDEAILDVDIGELGVEVREVDAGARA